MPGYPIVKCCCAMCPLPDNITFSAVEIFGVPATKYTDATVPNAGPLVFTAVFGAGSVNNEVWYYDDGDIEYWFFVRPGDTSCSSGGPYFDTYGYNNTLATEINNETYCCMDTLGPASWSATGLDTTWEAFP